MRRISYLLCLLAVCAMIGCAGDGYNLSLRTVDSLVNDHPDSALTLLNSMKGEVDGWNRSQRMRYHLLTMKAQNKAYVDFTSDSLGVKWKDSIMDFLNEVEENNMKVIYTSPSVEVINDNP